MLIAKRNLKRFGVAGALATLSFLSVGQAQAAPVYSAWSEFYAYNWYADPDTGGMNGVNAAYGPNQYVSDAALAQSGIAGTAYANGLNQFGEAATTTINYASAAQASLAGGLKAEASISGSNLFWNSANTPFVNADYSENPGGVPNFYSASAYSWIQDTLTISGASNLASVQFVFHLDGTLVGTSGRETNAFMNFVAGPTASSAYQEMFMASTKVGPHNPFISVDQTINSGVYDVVNGEVFLDLRLHTFADFGDWFGDSLSDAVGAVPDASASSNFFNTVKIAQVLGFNAAGEQVSLYSVKGSDGTILPAVQVPISAVPEPATWAMMITGFGLVGGTLRARNRRTLAAA